MINRILIANRGEIACRIIKTCKKLKITTTAIYSDDDKNAKHVKMADEAYFIGLPEFYANIYFIIETAKNAKADAIHPGYGFLSENFELAKACEENNITFIGPKSHAIFEMADKARAKVIMDKAKVPTIPGIKTNTQQDFELVKLCQNIGLPVMLKAALGGGGKGMRIVKDSKDLLHSYQSAKRESLKHFGDDTIIIEKYLPNARHIEVQIFGDNHGNVVHLFERDCSLQRRHQKIIEEAPAVSIPDNIKSLMYKAAINAAKAINYTSAGTVEFLYDDEQNFYFLEMNTRLQVEHPVTEMITGFDLVEWQIDVANNKKLIEQEEISCNGHAIEARIYAEDPTNEFLPATGTIHKIIEPRELENIRIESGIQDNDKISIHYDPMLCKIITFAKTRENARLHLQHTLNLYELIGIKNNLNFLRCILSLPTFIKAKHNTHTVENNIEYVLNNINQNNCKSVEAAALAFMIKQKLDNPIDNNNIKNSPWDQLNYWRLNSPNLQKLSLICNNKDVINLTIQHLDKYDSDETNSFFVTGDNIKSSFFISGELKHNQLKYKCGDRIHKIFYYFYNSTLYLFDQGNLETYSELYNKLNEDIDVETEDKIISPMPGIVTNIWVELGSKIKKGDKIIAVEAMKMEHTLWAKHNGIVKSINSKIGDQVQEGELLIDLEPEPEG